MRSVHARRWNTLPPFSEPLADGYWKNERCGRRHSQLILCGPTASGGPMAEEVFGDEEMAEAGTFRTQRWGSASLGERRDARGDDTIYRGRTRSPCGRHHRKHSRHRFVEGTGGSRRRKGSAPRTAISINLERCRRKKGPAALERIRALLAEGAEFDR